MTNREIDALVAEKLMGWKKYPANSPENKMDFDQWVGEDQRVVPQTEPPPYSTNISDAWIVVEKMKKDWLILIDNDKSGKWDAFFKHMTAEDKSYTSFNQESAPMAICLAALKSFGVTIEEKE